MVNLILNGVVDRGFIKSSLQGDGNALYVVDGALDKVKGLGLQISGVMGDLDSIAHLSSEHKFIKLEDQNYTDFEKSLIYLQDKYKKINIYGASGLEVDHFFANLSIAKKFLNDLDLVFYDPYNYYFLAENGVRLEGILAKTISILPFTELFEVRSSGLKYSLEGIDLTFGGDISVRNQAIDDVVEVKFKGVALVVVGVKS